MNIVKRISWISLGIAVGLLVSGSLHTSARAQERPLPRLLAQIGGSPVAQSNAYFIKDTKTGACWLTVRSRDDQTGSLAPAPAASCQQ